MRIATMHRPCGCAYTFEVSRTTVTCCELHEPRPGEPMLLGGSEGGDSLELARALNAPVKERWFMDDEEEAGCDQPSATKT